MLAVCDTAPSGTVPLIHDRPVSEDKAPVLPIQPVWVHLRQSEFPFSQCSEPQRGIQSGGRKRQRDSACTAAQPSEQESAFQHRVEGRSELLLKLGQRGIDIALVRVRARSACGRTDKTDRQTRPHNGEKLRCFSSRFIKCFACLMANIQRCLGRSHCPRQGMDGWDGMGLGWMGV